MVGSSSAWVVYAFRCGSANHHGSPLAIDGMHGTLRPSPTFKYSLQTLGWIRYLRNSFATVTFFAPFGIRPQVVRAWLVTGLPSFDIGRTIVTMSAYSSFLLKSATSVEIEPSRSITLVLASKALLSSASFQLIALGGTKPSLYAVVG